MARWTVTVNNEEIVIETTADGLVRIDVPDGPMFVDRRTVEDLRTKLGAAIADNSSEHLGE